MALDGVVKSRQLRNILPLELKRSIPISRKIRQSLPNQSANMKPQPKVVMEPTDCKKATQRSTGQIKHTTARAEPTTEQPPTFSTNRRGSRYSLVNG